MMSVLGYTILHPFLFPCFMPPSSPVFASSSSLSVRAPALATPPPTRSSSDRPSNRTLAVSASLQLFTSTLEEAERGSSGPGKFSPREGKEEKGKERKGREAMEGSVEGEGGGERSLSASVDVGVRVLNS
jgi:hypothetical protein